MFSKELNPQQWEAVRHTQGPLIVVAGAGSGKTRVITYRILYLILNEKVPPEKILAITFTNKAASEMRERVHQKLGASDSYPWISTFHSFCLRVLRKHIGLLGFTTDFVIYDAQDQLTLLKQCMKSANMNHEAFPPRTLLNHISGFKNDHLTPEDLHLDSLPYGNKLKAAEIYPRYQQTLRQNNALDFDDLLMMTVQLLRQDEALREHYHNRFHSILVDEFQDTNVTQYHLVKLLAGKHHNVCVVGDDDQSIYQWRGAHPDNILNFEKEFAGTRVIKLEQNYRSTQNILGAAGAVVKENTSRKDKTLWTENEKGNPVIYYRAADEMDEARVVCERIQQWADEPEHSYDDIAVLYRTNAQSRVMEDYLRQHDIPYKVIGGQRFYERREIKDILAYMRVALNPIDSVAVKRILNVPARGIGKTSVEKIEVYCREHDRPLMEGLRQASRMGLVGSGPAKKIGLFVDLIDGLAGVGQASPPLDFLNEILERTGYVALLERENTIESKSRLDNLRELVTAVETFIDVEREGTLQDYLDKASLVADADGLDQARGALQLMTLHTCKGLEFEAVFIIGLENGLLPHASSLSDMNQYEEERRLCYVGFTRAKKKLMLSNARRRRIYGSTCSYQPSDFLTSIPDEILERESSPEMDRSALHSHSYSRRGREDEPPQLRAAPAEGDYVVGTKVLHPKFGSGVVLNKEGKEEDLKLEVYFKKVGKKKLSVNHAKLIVV